MSPTKDQVFSSYDDFQSVYGKTKLDTELRTDVDEETLSDINGYPVKHSGNIVQVNHDTLPVYTKGSKTQFVAGFYAIKYAKWMPSLCPKLKTILEYDYKGPFKTKLEMWDVINKLNKD